MCLIGSTTRANLLLLRRRRIHSRVLHILLRYVLNILHVVDDRETISSAWRRFCIGKSLNGWRSFQVGARVHRRVTVSPRAYLWHLPTAINLHRNCVGVLLLLLQGGAGAASACSVVPLNGCLLL